MEGAILLDNIINDGKLKEEDLDGLIERGLDENVVRLWREMKSVPQKSELISPRSNDEMLNDFIDSIKPAPNMEPASASMWFEAEDCAPPEQMIDNNIHIDESVAKKQRCSTAIEEVRKKLMKKSENDTVAVGEYVLTLFNKIVGAGPLENVKKTASEIIMSGKDLDDNDLVVYVRIPLTDIFE